MHGRRFVLKFGGDDERERLQEGVLPATVRGPGVLPQEIFENNCAKLGDIYVESGRG